MLTRAGAQHLSDCTAFRDVTWDGGVRGLTSTFYLLDDAPGLASAEDGGPGYACYLYRGAQPTQSGGLLTVAITATPDPSQQDRIAGEIRTAFGLAPTDPVTIAPVQLDSGTVSLSYAGESGGTGGEFTTAVLGGGPTCGTGRNLATFAVTLTPDGAGLLLGALDSGAALLHAQFDLTVPYVLDDVSVRIWADTAAAYKAASDLAAAGPLTPEALVQSLSAQQLVGSSITSQRPLAPDEQQALSDLATTVLTDLVPTTLLDGSGALRGWSSDFDERLNVSLTGTYPATWTPSLTGNLSLPGDPAVRASRVVTFDLGADQLLGQYQVSAPGDMGARDIASIDVRLDYAGTAAGGAPITRTADVALRPSTGTAAVAFDLAAADQRTVQPHVSVFFGDGSLPYQFDLPPTAASVIALDLDTLGVIVVQASLGVVDPSLGASAVLDFSYGATTNFDASLVLDGTASAGHWRAAVREPPGDYRWRVTWVAGATRLVGDWQTDSRRSLQLDAPLALTPPTSTVSFFSAGDFTDLAELLIEVRQNETAPTSVLTFAATDQSATWTTTATPLAYQFRQTTVLASGAHVVGAWTDDNRAIQIVRDNLRFPVQVEPQLLGLGAAIRSAVVEIAGPDPTVANALVALSTPQDRPSCVLRLLDPANHTYRYRVTVSPTAGGADRTSPWGTGTSSILVVQPPV